MDIKLEIIESIWGIIECYWKIKSKLNELIYIRLVRISKIIVCRSYIAGDYWTMIEYGQFNDAEQFKW